MDPDFSFPFRDAREALKRYAVRHPEEAGALHPLQEQLQGDADIFHRTNMRGHITTSALVLDATLRHVLLIHHRAFDAWLQPGGHYELPGSLWQSAAREVAEETGLHAVKPFRALDAFTPLDIETHAIPARASKGEGAHRHHDFAYLAVAQSDTPFVPQLDEVIAARWAALEELAAAPLARTRRLAAKTLRLLRA
jgi:8-oxo-dGTP pyrophosphatase MutT (NUDIX family)